MKWWWSVLSHTTTAFVPHRAWFRAVKRRLIRDDWSIDGYTFTQGLYQLQLLRERGYSLHGKVVLEIGSGWQPTIPLLYRLAGAKKIYLVDNDRHIDFQSLAATVRYLRTKAGELSQALGLHAEQVSARLSDEASGLEQLLAANGLIYLAPSDARHTNLPAGSIDVICSRAVLEHIPPDVLQAIFMECRRLIHDDGWMVHMIDHSDHYEHRDKSIPRLNYLKYPDLVWQLLCLNPADYTNRLRFYEFVPMFSRAGFAVSFLRAEPHAEALEQLDGMRLCKRYRHVRRDELAVLESYFVLRPNFCQCPVRSSSSN
jgi:hypothetical protein